MISANYAVYLVMGLSFLLYTASGCAFFCSTYYQVVRLRKKPCLPCLKQKFQRFSSKHLTKFALSRCRGFTLVEVMVAAAILGISLLLIYNVLVKTFMAGSRAEAKVIANNFAQEIMEDIINRPYSKIALWAGAGTTVPSTFTIVERDAAHTTYDEEMIKITSGTESDYVPYEQNRTVAGIDFEITTVITWHDDSIDNSAPADPNPNDYKRVHITVTWGAKPSPATKIILDRFVSLYFKPHANGSGTADAGEIRLTAPGATDYVRLGFSTTESYSGGNTTAKAEAKNAYTKNTIGTVNNSGDSVAWARGYSDDESHTPDIPTAVQETDNGNNITDGSISTLLPDAQYLPPAKTASGITNIIGDSTYGNWHSGEFASEGIWDSWISPPDWDTGNDWNQPSSIAKSDSGLIKWQYSPTADPVNFVEIGRVQTGSKLVTTSATSGNRINQRNWSACYNVHLIELNDFGGETLPPEGLIKADSIKIWSETRSDGQSDAVVSINWLITNLSIWNRTTHQYDTYATVDSSNPLPVIDWPDPIDDTSVEIGDTSTTVSSTEGTVSGTVFKMATNASTIGAINVPASLITIGVLNNSVAYTWQ